jgi:tetratricopeptide (TPR) repeat protein
MSALPSPTDTTARAARLDSLLASLQGELDAANNPHRVALGHLGINLEGWTAKAYENMPFTIWSRVLDLDADDVDSRHHLAIMLHARAIDREQGERPDKADADWEAALAHWTELWRRDAFWDRIAAAVCPPDSGGGVNRKAVDELRKRFPALLLRLHMDIALDPATPHHRARHHVGLVLKSALPDAAKEAARRGCYETHAAAIPVEVWNDGLPHEELIARGIAVVKAYLNLDPEGEAALADALQLEHRMLRVQLNQLTAAGGDAAERTRILGRLHDAVQAWRPYFEHLARRAEQIGDEVRRQLCLWYRLAGDVLCAVDRMPEAIPLYEQGLACGQEHDPERARCRREVPQTLATIARGMAQRGDSGALEYADSVNARADLTTSALQQLGNAYLALDQLDKAGAACTRGLAIEIDFGDESAEQDTLARERIAELAQFIEKLRQQRRAHELYLQASEHFSAARPADAVALLDACIALVPDANAYHYLRARCHVALLEPQKAQQDLVQYRRTMADTDEDRKFEALVANELRDCEAEVARFGRASLLKRREAARLFGQREFEQAAMLLRQAIDDCAKDGLGEIRSELSVVLAQWAVAEANAAIDNRQLDPPQRLAALVACRDRLAQAHGLDPANAQAAKNREAIDAAIADARPDAELAEAIGGEAWRRLAEALRLLQAGDTRAARAQIDQAVQACPAAARARLERHWADALVSASVAAANAAQEGSRSASGRIAAYEGAMELLDLAVARDPQFERAATNRATLRDILSSALRSQAAEAYNAKLYPQAEEHLRRALKHCPEAQRKALSSELSIVLTNRAVADVNDLVEKRNRLNRL